MTTFQFSLGSLVLYQDAIYQIINSSKEVDTNNYTVKLLAYCREQHSQELEIVSITHEKDVQESDLSLFSSQAPKFALGESVKLNGDIACIVQFIQYKNGTYTYTLRKRDPGSSTLREGWIVEEVYISK